MSPKDTIFRMMISHPRIFPTIGECLNHLFIVYGNGFDWVDGELVDSYPDARPYPYFESEDNLNNNELLSAFSRLDIRRLNNRVQFVLDNFELMWEYRIHCRIDAPYPIEEYSAIWYPDMNPEWREAAIEFIDMMRVSMITPPSWDKIKEQLNHLIDNRFPEIRLRDEYAIEAINKHMDSFMKELRRGNKNGY